MFALAVQKFFRQALKQDESSYILSAHLRSLSYFGIRRYVTSDPFDSLHNSALHHRLFIVKFNWKKQRKQCPAEYTVPPFVNRRLCGYVRYDHRYHEISTAGLYRIGAAGYFCKAKQ